MSAVTGDKTAVVLQIARHHYYLALVVSEASSLVQCNEPDFETAYELIEYAMAAIEKVRTLKKAAGRNEGTPS